MSRSDFQAAICRTPCGVVGRTQSVYPALLASSEYLSQSCDREYFSRRFKMCIACSTHNVDRFIASHTDWPSLFSFFPFVTRSNAQQTLTNNNPSSTQCGSPTIESYVGINLEQIVRGEQETYSDYCKERANGAKYGLGWCDGRGLFCEIQGSDDCIQG